MSILFPKTSIRLKPQEIAEMLGPLAVGSTKAWLWVFWHAGVCITALLDGLSVRTELSRSWMVVLTNGAMSMGLKSILLLLLRLKDNLCSSLSREGSCKRLWVASCSGLIARFACSNGLSFQSFGHTRSKLVECSLSCRSSRNRPMAGQVQGYNTQRRYFMALANAFLQGS